MSVAVGTTTAQTPLQANFGGLKSHVAAYVQGQNLASVLADAGAAINAAADKINTRNWNWLNKASAITLAADTKSYTIPANFKSPRSLIRRDTNAKQVGLYIYQIPKEFVNTAWDDTNSGQPTHYTIRNAPDDRLLNFNVPPSSAFATSWPTALLIYYSRMGHFASDGDTLGTLEVPSEIRNFLVWYARWEIASIRGSATQIRTAESAWRTEWNSLMMDDNNQQTDFGAGVLYR